MSASSATTADISRSVIPRSARVASPLGDQPTQPLLHQRQPVPHLRHLLIQPRPGVFQRRLSVALLPLSVCQRSKPRCILDRSGPQPMLQVGYRCLDPIERHA